MPTPFTRWFCHEGSIHVSREEHNPEWTRRPAARIKAIMSATWSSKVGSKSPLASTIPRLDGLRVSLFPLLPLPTHQTLDITNSDLFSYSSKEKHGHINSRHPHGCPAVQLAICVRYQKC